jgi:hypothetical protein
MYNEVCEAQFVAKSSMMSDNFITLDVTKYVVKQWHMSGIFNTYKKIHENHA